MRTDSIADCSVVRALCSHVGLISSSVCGERQKLSGVELLDGSHCSGRYRRTVAYCCDGRGGSWVIEYSVASIHGGYKNGYLLRRR